MKESRDWRGGCEVVDRPAQRDDAGVKQPIVVCEGKDEKQRVVEQYLDCSSWKR